ncbi:MAG: amino acid adenylation domain-containing protein, partial [Synergistaceae bacterium]|nr:amino acid adenylation domain-containing protein [Synergistaceae bacterium]
IEPYRQTVMEMTEDEWNRTLPRLMAEPLQLVGGRLFRFDLVQTEKAKYFLRTAHHIAFDGTAYNSLFADVAAAYNGQDVTPESYNALDAARDEAEKRSGPEFEAAKKWYEENFSGLDAESLPLFDLCGKPDAFEAYEHFFPLDYDAMRNFCHERKISASSLASAAFGFTVGTYTHQSEALFSTIYHGRKDERTAHIIGMFVKTLPVSCRWEADTKITDLLTALTAQLKGCRENDLFSFADLNKICPMNDKPLFAYHGMIKTTSTFCGLPCQEKILDENTTGNPLEVELMGEPSGMKLHIEYNSGKYSRSFIETFARTYENVLNQMMSVETVRDIQPANGEQRAILDSFNDTDTPYDASQTIVSLFRKAAKENADRTAVIFNDIKLTYRELDDITDRLAGTVVGKGLGQGDVVSILIPRGEYMPIASIGALKAGCAYQPLDPTYPPERLNFMVKDSGAKLLITTEELKPLITDYTGDVLMLKVIPSLPALSVKLPEPKPADLFILLYTSGTTGTPKGVRLTHGNLVCFVNWYHRYYDLQPEDCVGQYASYGFDACMMDMYSPLTRGAALCINPEEIRLDLVAINEYMEKNHDTHQFMTTQVGRQFAVNIENHSLKHLSVGGEKLVSLTPPANYTFHNGYGPTECTIFSTIYPVKENAENIPIGKPLDNMKAYIVDSSGHRVPVGALGELWFSGPQVGDGYLNRPEKTAEVFIDNPFNSPGRVYKTGDIARYREDGNIEFFGRRDGQVKIRGFRIELSEVEAVIRQFPGVEDATVAAFDNESGEGKYLAAYVVSSQKIDVKALGNFIRSQKPPYMVPAVTMQIDHIPLNQNSKVNKRALPKPEIKAEDEAEDNSRPLNVLEEELCAIVGKVIDVTRAPLTVPLIHLGLDSIRSIQFSVQLYKRFGVEIPSRTLLDGATLEDVENTILRGLLSGNTKPGETRAEKYEADSAPLSYPQMGVYYDCMKRPSEMLYNVPSLFAFPKDMDVQKLSGAIEAIVEAHPALTAHFELKDGNVVQVRGTDEVKIELLEMTEAKLETYKKAFVRPFDLSKGPLCRFAVVKTEGRVGLLADFHHLVFDGASLSLFIKELSAALDGKEPQPEEYTYFDYVADEKKFEASEEFEANKKYFAEMLSDFESASEVTPDMSGREEDGGMARAASPFDLSAAADFCKSQGTTPAALFLAASFYAVSRYVNDDHVYLSTISNGRSDVRTAETYGM